MIACLEEALHIAIRCSRHLLLSPSVRIIIESHDTAVMLDWIASIRYPWSTLTRFTAPHPLTTCPHPLPLDWLKSRSPPRWLQSGTLRPRTTGDTRKWAIDRGLLFKDVSQDLRGHWHAIIRCDFFLKSVPTPDTHTLMRWCDIRISQISFRPCLSFFHRDFITGDGRHRNDVEDGRTVMLRCDPRLRRSNRYGDQTLCWDDPTRTSEKSDP